MADTNLTIFDGIDRNEIKEAIKNLISGKTPIKEVKQRQVGGGFNANYVNTYYMTRQISLITGFKWSSECLEERMHPATGDAKELGAKMKVTIWDNKGNQYSHISWGSVEVKKNVGFFDQWKAAYSDGIKKCLSYFGIANDVYGGKDLDYFGSEPSENESAVVVDASQMRDTFHRYLRDRHILVSKACEMLGITNINEVVDFKEAYNRLKEVYK